jgi:LPXTG-motif cell wall-anchored protein
VPSVCRRIVVLLVVALLGVGAPVTAAYAQGAGDQQYEDPFGGDDGSSGSNGSGSSGSGGGGGSNSDSNGDIEPITPAPQTSGGGTSGSGAPSGTAGTAPSGTATSPTAPAATGQLPNTGLDTRVLIIAGAVLVLAGLGLRLRNAPERF